MGLSICAALAQLTGGTVGLDSSSGRGGGFHAEFLRPAVAADALIAGKGDARLLDAPVLLVEDNNLNMMIGVALPEHWGVRVTKAADGHQAAATLASAAAAGQAFDAGLMNLRMPNVSGYQATELLRQRHSAAQWSVIALTAAALVNKRERARTAGMNGFLTKPIDPQNLHRALLQALQHLPARLQPHRHHPQAWGSQRSQAPLAG